MFLLLIDFYFRLFIFLAKQDVFRSLKIIKNIISPCVTKNAPFIFFILLNFPKLKHIKMKRAHNP